MGEVDPRDARIAQLEARHAEDQATIAELRRELAAARATIAELRATIAELRERLGRDSSNSDKPPSTDGPEGRRRRNKKPRGSGRRPGGQVGHEAHGRQLLPEDQVDEVRPVLPRACSKCGGPVEEREEGPPASRHQVWEVPEVKPHVTEWRLVYGYCAGCQRWTQGELPEGVPTGTFGPRLMALVAYMTGLLRLPKRPVQWLLRDVLGVEVALGSISKVEAQVSQALAEPVEQARQYIRKQTGPVHLDDTGWHEGPLRKALWVAATALVAVFLIAEGRSKKVAQWILGEGFKGMVVADRARAHWWLGVERWQVCWSHLQRNFRSWVDRGRGACEVGKQLLEYTATLFQLLRRVHDGTLERGTMVRRMDEVRQRVRELLEKARECADEKAAHAASELLGQFKALWTFMHHEDVPATNNHAERLLRHAVCMRKVSFGTKSPEGSRFIERILTAVTTLRLQNRPVLPFLTRAVESWLHGHGAPSLLPSSLPPLHAAA
ncbi:IS66 family transposase [Archangium minus]|uniref:IS66 family transposase n=1 Tax=Archangium minus TaxID=83450 RepID=A0ABY9X693_9BACT|nr:IS66 family transposase [Archangium minus]WNG50916.1 IS66 family transposase [Archangium minus]